MTPTSPAFHDSQRRRAIAPRPLRLLGRSDVDRHVAHAVASGPPVSVDARDLRRDAGRDRVDDLLLGRLTALVDGDVLAEAEDRDPVGHLEDVVEVVRDEDDREPLLGEAAHEVEHLPRLRDAERGRRLVEDHDA